MDLGLEADRARQGAILEALAWQSRSPVWTERQRAFRLTAGKYLHDQRWTDERPVEPATMAGPATPGITPEEQEARFREAWERDPENRDRRWPGYAHG